ncbi:MAG: UPF0175 family protein [Nitrosopumilus sp.]|nr:UPF0175 family protein [Nitrosopumilus sp.]MDA7958587.1 UPF0175 family protein [Nitrosopumilus sp.]
MVQKADATRRDMYMLLRATEHNRDTDPVAPAERIHEALYILGDIRRVSTGHFEIKRDGCHSPSLERALGEAVESGEVVRDESGVGAYSLTARGLEAAEGTWGAANVIERADASDAKYKVINITDRELVSYLYGDFPETWTDPDTKAMAREWGFDAACTMYEKTKISISEGARMSGMAYAEFMWAYCATGRPMSSVTAEEMERDLKAFDNTR